jgi:hypothetical protein
MSDAHILEAVLRAELSDRADPAAEELCEHVHRADQRIVATIVWHLTTIRTSAGASSATCSPATNSESLR